MKDLHQKLQMERESFESFFSGLEPQQEKDAVNLYANYLINATLDEVKEVVDRAVSLNYGRAEWISKDDLLTKLDKMEKEILSWMNAYIPRGKTVPVFELMLKDYRYTQATAILAELEKAGVVFGTREGDAFKQMSVEEAQAIVKKHLL